MMTGILYFPYPRDDRSGFGSPSAHIEAAVAGYAPSLRREKFLVVLQAYIDDSANDHGPERPLFLAGYVHSADQWAAFSHHWDFALRRRPAIPYLHMAEAEAMRGPFKGWSREARDKKLLKLAEVVWESVPFAIECSISRTKYEALVAPFATYQLKNPFFICFYGLMNSLARWHESRGARLPVDFIFDEHGLTGREALLWYDYLKNDGSDAWRKLLGGTPQFKSDIDVLPLQAADMLAWHLRRASTSRFLDRHRAVLDLLLGDEHLAITLPDERLVSIAQAFSSMGGVDQVQDEKTWRALAPLLERRLAAGLGPPTRWENLSQRVRETFVTFGRTKGLRIVRKARRLLRIIRRR